MKYSIVFPGQGSQSLGMLSDLSDNFSVVNEIFQEASDAINVDLWKIINEDQELLNLTENTQPIMLAAGYATVSRFCRDYCSPGSLSVYIYQYCCHPGAHVLNPLIKRMKDKYIFISILFSQVYCRNYTFILNFVILKTCINFQY
jgi:hypothetical protein